MDEIEQIRKKEIERLYTELSSKKEEVAHVMDANFDEFIANNKVAIVDCYATWCGPCRMLSPIIEDLSKEFAGRVRFGKMDVDENRNVPSRYGVYSVPTLLVAKDGKVVDAIVGAVPKPQLKRAIERYLQ